jgi:hypothetical protein
VRLSFPGRQTEQLPAGRPHDRPVRVRGDDRRTRSTGNLDGSRDVVDFKVKMRPARAMHALHLQRRVPRPCQQRHNSLSEPRRVDSRLSVTLAQNATA